MKRILQLNSAIQKNSDFSVVKGYAKKLQLSISLGKPNLSIFVSASAVTGCLLSSNPIDSSLVSLFAGTLLCSLSANAFNQLYEIKTDKLMNRTRFRPLPSQKLTPKQGLMFASTNAILGPLLLYTSCGPLTAVLGVTNLVLYAGVYTPLKQKTVLNTWVGSVVGAIPPLMGFLVNSDISQLLLLEAWILPSLLFFWQFPHFFALSFMHRDDYKRGGHKMLSDVSFDKTGMKTANNIMLYSVLQAMIPFLGYSSEIYSIMLPIEGVLINGYFLLLAKRFRDERSRKNARKLFLGSLWYLPLVMSLMVLHKKNKTGESELLLKVKNFGKDICFHEWFVDPTKAEEEKPFCTN